MLSVTVRASSGLAITTGRMSSTSSVRSVVVSFWPNRAPMNGSWWRIGMPKSESVASSRISPPSITVSPLRSDTVVSRKRFWIVGESMFDVVVTTTLETSWTISSVTMPLAFTRGVTSRFTPVLRYCTEFTIKGLSVTALVVVWVTIGTSSPTRKCATRLLSTRTLGDESMFTSVSADSTSMTRRVRDEPSSAKLKPGNNALMIGVTIPSGDVATVRPRVNVTSPSSAMPRPPLEMAY